MSVLLEAVPRRAGTAGDVSSVQTGGSPPTRDLNGERRVDYSGNDSTIADVDRFTVHYRRIFFRKMLICAIAPKTTFVVFIGGGLTLIFSKL